MNLLFMRLFASTSLKQIERASENYPYKTTSSASTDKNSIVIAHFPSIIIAESTLQHLS